MKRQQARKPGSYTISKLQPNVSVTDQCIATSLNNDNNGILNSHMSGKVYRKRKKRISKEGKQEGINFAGRQNQIFISSEKFRLPHHPAHQPLHWPKVVPQMFRAGIFMNWRKKRRFGEGFSTSRYQFVSCALSSAEIRG